MVRPFTKEDLELMNSWYRDRNLNPIDEHLLPDVGFIDPQVGAGFLYQTDSSLCFMDGYISSPNSTQEQRKEAFDTISNLLIRTAKDHGFRQILAYTKHPEIRKRCERFQFAHKGQYELYVRGI